MGPAGAGLCARRGLPGVIRPSPIAGSRTSDGSCSAAIRTTCWPISVPRLQCGAGYHLASRADVRDSYACDRDWLLKDGKFCVADAIPWVKMSAICENASAMGLSADLCESIDGNAGSVPQLAGQARNAARLHTEAAPTTVQSWKATKKLV